MSHQIKKKKIQMLNKINDNNFQITSPNLKLYIESIIVNYFYISSLSSKFK